MLVGVQRHLPQQRGEAGIGVQVVGVDVELHAVHHKMEQAQAQRLADEIPAVLQRALQVYEQLRKRTLVVCLGNGRRNVI